MLHVGYWAQALNICNSIVCSSTRFGKVDCVDVLGAEVGSLSSFYILCVLDKIEVLCDEYKAIAFGNLIFR